MRWVGLEDRIAKSIQVGTLVKIVDRDFLENFMRTWKLHNKLQPDQLDYAGKAGIIKSVGFYHGGDELYQIEAVPGIWHECCLEECTTLP